MRKSILGPRPENSTPPGAWLDLESLAHVEVTSEDPEHPIEGALLLHSHAGWRAGAPGPQTIRLLFDQPQTVHRVQLLFLEDRVERHQEFVLRWSPAAGEPARDLVRQQYNFSPGGAVRELEDFRFELEALKSLEVTIIPDKAGGSAHATLAHLRLA